MDDGREARQGAREIVDPEWGEHVRAALTQQGMSANAAATEIGVSAATLGAWLSGGTAPPIRAMRKLADLTGLSLNLQLEMAGWMPGGTRAASYQVQVAGRVTQALDDMRTAAEQWKREASLSPAASVAGTLIEALADFQVTLRRDARGRGREHNATYLGFARSDDQASRSGRYGDDEAARTTDRDRIEQEREENLSLEAVQWRSSELIHGWPDAPDLVLMCPQLERSRPPGPSLERRQPIAVIGTTFSHAETIGAKLADSLGYGFMNASWAVQERYGVTRDEDENRDVQSRLVNQWLSADDRQLDGYVIGWTDAQVHENCWERLTQWPGQVSFIESPDQIIELGSQLWCVPAETIARAQRLLQDTMARRDEQASKCVRLQLPRGFAKLPGRDAQVDAAWDAAGSLVDLLERELAE